MPRDLDRSRAEVARRGLVADAAGHLTAEVAGRLPFESLGPFKTLLKRFFSTQPWSDEHAGELDALVATHVTEGWWSHDLDGELRMSHGMQDGRYVLTVTGAGTGGARRTGASPFDRMFAGAVVPEPTPHPRKVKFATGGSPAPGIWYQRSDPEPAGDQRVRRLLAEDDVTDVMVAGDFVTIGLERGASWDDRLEDLLSLVTELFAAGEQPSVPARTRDELVREARRIPPRPEELHLLDPDDQAHRRLLGDALESPDARVRRIAVAVLAEAADADVRRTALRRGWGDRSRLVRRTAVDAAADTGDEALRDLFEDALRSEDAWTRWKAVRSLGELGAAPSVECLEPLTRDPDFQVRLETAKVLRADGTDG